jgi:6-phosphogluconate dehydrogenase
LDSFLIEITANIFSKKDPETGKALVDVILDNAGQKGTGRWTLQSAIQQAVVVSTINAAVEARVLSAIKDQRVKASEQLPAPPKFNYPGDRQGLIGAVRDALYASKNYFLRSGIHLVRCSQQTVQLESALRRYCHDLARRMHYPGEILEPDKGSFRSGT